MKRVAKLLSASVAVVALTGTVAYAGLKTAFSVTINTTARTAYGQFGTARNSSDTIQRIYCRTNASSSGTEYVQCFATDLSGTYVSCYSNSAALVRSAQSIITDAYVEFDWDASSTCTEIDVLKGSHLAPKQP